MNFPSGGLETGSGPWANISPVIRLSFSKLTEFLQNSSDELARQKSEMHAVRAEVEALRRSASIRSLESEKERVELTNLAAEVRRLSKSEDDWTSRRALNDARQPSVNDLVSSKADRQEVVELRRALDRAKADARKTADRVLGLEDALREVGRLPASTSSTSNPGLEARVVGVEVSMAELRALVSEKASKESVGNALHRKASKELLDQELSAVKRSLGQLEAQLEASAAPSSSPPSAGSDAAFREIVLRRLEALEAEVGELGGAVEDLRGAVGQHQAKHTVLAARALTAESALVAELDRRTVDASDRCAKTEEKVAALAIDRGLCV